MTTQTSKEKGEIGKKECLDIDMQLDLEKISRNRNVLDDRE
jgi:hypothetical protein